MNEKTAVIGSGMAGLACALALRDAGRNVVVFDKGRGPGGRIASRRIEGATFDHGAQFIRPRDAGFNDWLHKLGEAGSAAPWNLPEPAGTSDVRAHDPVWVGTPDMNTLMVGLSTSLDVVQSTNIQSVTRSGDGWTLETTKGGQLGPFGSLVVTIPAPQAAGLIAPVAGEQFAALNAVTYAPCMTAMAAFETALDDIPDAARLTSPSQGGGTLPADGPIGWIARTNAKPGRSHTLEAWVIQAHPEWSSAHADDEKPAIAAALFEAFRDQFPSARRQQPVYLEGHRWRYALVTNPVGSPCLADEMIRLAVAGDGLIGPRVEAAFLSGRAAAAKVLSWS